MALHVTRLEAEVDYRTTVAGVGGAVPRLTRPAFCEAARMIQDLITEEIGGLGWIGRTILGPGLRAVRSWLAGYLEKNCS